MSRMSNVMRGGGESAGRRTTMKPSPCEEIVIHMSQIAPHIKVNEAVLMNPTTDFIISVWTSILETLNIDIGYISQPALFLPNFQLELYEGSYLYVLLFKTVAKVMKDFDVTLHFRDLMEPKSKRTCFLMKRFMLILNCVYRQDEYIDELMKARRYKQEKLSEFLELEEHLRLEYQTLQDRVTEDDAAVKKVAAETDELFNILKEMCQEKRNLTKQQGEMKAKLEKNKANLDAIMQGIVKHEDELQKLKSACVSSPDRFQKEADMKLQELDSVNDELLAEESREEAIGSRINIMGKWKEFFADIHAKLAEMSNVAKSIKEKESDIREHEQKLSSLGKDFNEAVKSRDFCERAQKSNKDRIQSVKIQHEAKMASLKKELKKLKGSLDKYTQQLQEREVIAAGLQEEHLSLIQVKSEQDKFVEEYKGNALREYAEMTEKLQAYQTQVSNAASGAYESLQKGQNK